MRLNQTSDDVRFCIAVASLFIAINWRQTDNKNVAQFQAHLAKQSSGGCNR